MSMKVVDDVFKLIYVEKLFLGHYILVTSAEEPNMSERLFSVSVPA